MKALLRRRGLGNGSCTGIKEASKQGIDVVRNDRVAGEYDVIFRWGCTSIVQAKRTINSSKAIHAVNDKAGFRALLKERAPDTIPTTYFHPNELVYPLREPVVVRRSPHHQGRYLHLCKDEAAVRAACGRYERFYISDYIAKVKEFRVVFAQGRVVWVADKTPADANAIAWNVAQGGRFDNVRWDNWPIEAIKTAHGAFMVSGLDFGAVDIMVDAGDKAYVLEINSAPSMTSNYRKQCMAKAFDWIVEEKPVDPVENIRKYKDVIHPSLLNKEAA